MHLKNRSFINILEKHLLLFSRYLQPQIKQHRKSWQAAEFSLKGYLDQKVLVLPYLTGVSANLCTGALWEGCQDTQVSKEGRWRQSWSLVAKPGSSFPWFSVLVCYPERDISTSPWSKPCKAPFVQDPHSCLPPHVLLFTTRDHLKWNHHRFQIKST